MTSVRAAKSKGSSFEYDCQESLQAIYPDIYRTSERGFQLQYDLQSDKPTAVFECKRLKGMSWNKAVRFIKKLEAVRPDTYPFYLLFQSNFQPCLVMTYNLETYKFTVRTFEHVFNTPFKKHTSTRVKKEVIHDGKQD